MTRYVIITPVRDEEKYIEATLECVLRHTILPVEWVIVDDGSTDRTGAILDRYAVQYPWIRVIHRLNRGFRKSGGGVMEAFSEGYNSLRCNDWEFIAKLDGDLSFAPEYFEKCFEYFRRDPELGIGGGQIFHDISGALKLEKTPSFTCEGLQRFTGPPAGRRLAAYGQPRDGTRSTKSKQTCWDGRRMHLRTCIYFIIVSREPRTASCVTG